MTFHCRTTVPAVSRWYEIEADTPEEAAANFHCEHGELEMLRVSVEEPQRCSVAFVLVEVVDQLEGEDLLIGARGVRRVEGLEEDDGHAQEIISRTFHTGIYRRGGVKPAGWKPTKDRLVEIAKLLGWTQDPQDLIAEGWDLEESWDEAARKKSLTV